MGRDGPFADSRSCSCSAARIARVGVVVQRQRGRFRRHVVGSAPAGDNLNLHNVRRSAPAVLLHRRQRCLLPLWSPQSPPRRLDCDGCGCPQHSARWSGTSALRSGSSAHWLEVLQSSVALSLASGLSLASRLVSMRSATRSRPFPRLLTGTFYLYEFVEVQLHAPTHIRLSASASASASALSAMTLALLVVLALISSLLCFSSLLDFDKLLIQIRSQLTLRSLSKWTWCQASLIFPRRFCSQV